MKRLPITITLATILFSCQQNSNKNTEADTLALEAVSSVSDTMTMPTEEEIITSESAPEESGDQEYNSPEDFDYTYEGLINNQIKVKVNVFKFRGEQKARAVYMNTKKIINMEAVYPSVGVFELTERIDGKPTGIWKLEAKEEDVLSGTWNSADGTKKMSVQLGMTSEPFDAFLPKGEVKTGIYELRELNEDPETKQEFPVIYSEELYVKNMAGNTVYFDLYIQGPPPGVHIGMINGMAEKVGNAYVYRNEEGCEITMTFSADAVTLSQKGRDFDCGFGANIGAYGTLKKKE